MIKAIIWLGLVVFLIIGLTNVRSWKQVIMVLGCIILACILYAIGADLLIDQVS